ncbi:protein regulator of cytokinesis 1-like [Anoplophora glabripennis]|uniref:protein regulator of cytokinesis 1-like n=1 Tax=Anoplophora glabripennis TaxID=217634 RepID=UPI000874AB98|nr:protein regulator of cytokinesis 1-like [Anoplophora glabripennis]
MRNVLEDGLSKTILYWCEMVLNMGESEDIVKSWVTIFIKTFEGTCCVLVSDMELLQSKVLLKIKELQKEFEELCYTLQISMPVLGDTTQKLSLHQEHQELKKHINEYKKRIEVIRRCEQKKLHEKQLELCNMLGKEPKILMDNPLPSTEKLEEFQQHVEKLEAEKYNRLEKFSTVKEELLEIVSELNVEPSSQFEKKVFSSDDSVFLVTDENMKQLDLLHKNLTRQQKNVKEEIVHLYNKIDDYWNLLDIDLKEREDFRQKHIGNSLDVLRALQKEIKRCEELKKANIKVFIDKRRNELKQLWENCHCSHTTRMQFGFFNSDCYNEDLLELHEIEILKWKKYFEENKELLALLEKHAGLWNKMMRLEENNTGPNRYNNRGGQLLKEEKERNQLAKQIPQIEKMLYNLADKYKQQQNISFTTKGISVLDYLSNLHKQWENAKKQKQSARKMQREQIPAKSAQTLFPPTNRKNLRSGPPQSTTKRKLGTETKKLEVLTEGKPQKGKSRDSDR